MRRNSYVVTGGAGFIGSNLVSELNRRGHEDILIVDHLDTAGMKEVNLRALRFAEYRDKAEFRQMLKHGSLPPPDTVFHLGACSATTEMDEDYLRDNNFDYSRALCGWCLENGVRFVYASSAATYGDGSLGYNDGDEQLLELVPLNPYGRSKQMFDEWAWHEKLFSKIAGLKYFNVYGPGEAHKGEMRSMIHKAYFQVVERGEIALFKSHHPDYRDGEQKRDFVAVRDAVAVTLFFHDHPEVSGLFNCGTGTARSWNDLARAVFSSMDREPRIRFVDMPEAIRSNYQYFTEADMRKLRGNGYRQPFLSLEEGVDDYIRNHLSRV